MSRTDQEIVDQTNTLALKLLAEGFGYVPSEGENFKLYEHLDNPRYQQAWRLACMAQELITSTDPNDALSAIDGMTTYEVILTERHYYTVRVVCANREGASEMAREIWANSEHPFDEFHGTSDGIAVDQIDEA